MKDFIHFPLFQNIQQEELTRMLHCAKAVTKDYQAGEYVFKQDDKPTRLYLLLRGKLHIAKDLASGRRDVLYLVEEGNVFGEIFLFGNKERYWYHAEAVTDCKVLALPWDFFYHFCSNACEHHKQLTQNMLEIIAERNFQITKKLHIVSTSSLRERITIWLLDAVEDKDRITLTMNRETLADFLGVTRPALSRELMRMQREGLLEVSKKEIVILDRNRLEEISC